MLKNLLSWLTILTSVTSCAAIVQPSSQPSSLETGGAELIEAGDFVRAEGVYFTIPAFRENLKAQRLKELDLQEQIAEAQLERDQDARALKIDAFCAKWCLPIGLFVGVLGGGVFGVWAGSKK